MINSTTIQNMDEYASDVSAEKERPDNDNYGLGVKNGWTAPAKWWNWLFNELTKRVGEERADVTVIIDEIKAILTEASIQPDATNNAQLKTAILSILQRIATNANPGMVKSSNADGEVQVNSSTGIMEVNGIGDFSELPAALSSAYTLIDAIDMLYTQLQTMSVGVPPQPSSYDTANSVLDTTTLEPGFDNDPSRYGAVYLDAGWYYVDIAGGAGGDLIAYSQIEGEAATIVATRLGGIGGRSMGWIFVMSPGEYWYGVGSSGGHTFVNFASTTPESTVGGGGTSPDHGCINPSYLNGVAGTVPNNVTTSNVSQSTAGTGGASFLFSVPAQEMYSVAGGSGGAWGVKNYVNLVLASYLPGLLTVGETEPAQQKPWGVYGWGFTNASATNPNPAAINTANPGQTPAGQNGWVKIYRGVTAAPST